MGGREEFLQIWQQHITRPGSEKLLDWLDHKTDFFTAPASTRFHGACEGGLCMHSLNVYHALHDTFFAEGDSEETFAICALLHDLCKANYAKVASGGELSRIMLAIKSLLAGEDEIETLIFDEIDTGISGKTASMVAEKLAKISANHQVICISHLSQIAAMADSHYLIKKDMEDNSTATNIVKLTREESIKEIVRINGDGTMTDAAIAHAIEMKDMADRTKSNLV